MQPLRTGAISCVRDASQDSMQVAEVSAELHLKLVPSLQFIAALLGEPPPQQIDVSISRCCPKLNRRPALATARLKLGHELPEQLYH